MSDIRKFRSAILAIIFSVLNGGKCHFTIQKPNIVVILLDDAGRNDFSIHGSDQIPTPNIDALGYNGIVFDKHYSMHICTPSRAALLTGNFPIRSGMQGSPILAGEPRYLPHDMPTMAEQFKKLGYKNYLVGKWHLGHQNRNVTPLGRGFHSHVGYWNGLISYFGYEAQDLIQYKNYVVEKWHWGFQNQNVTPLRSEFHSHVGYWNSLISDFGYEAHDLGLNGYDLHRNFAPSYKEIGKYATDLFTEESIQIIEKHDKANPLFLYLSHLGAHTGSKDKGMELGVPNVEQAHKKFSYIEDPRRRLYAEIMAQLDKSVGLVVEALSRRHMLRNTIILVMSDNGAPTTGVFQNSGSNWPFRGIKQTLSEGSIRNLAVLWSKDIKNKSTVIKTPVHIVDWLPTLYAAAGGNVKDLGKLDGINHWPMITQAIESTPRPDILINIDEEKKYDAIMSSDGHYKYTVGRFANGMYDQYYGDSGRSSNIPIMSPLRIILSKVNMAIQKTVPRPLTIFTITSIRKKLEVQQSTAERGNLTCDPCLFDLFRDPTETTDVFAAQPEIVQKLSSSLEKYRLVLYPQRNTAFDPNSNPALCKGTWHTWLDPVHKCDWSDNVI